MQTNIIKKINQAVDWMEYGNFEEYLKDHEGATYKQWRDCYFSYNELSVYMSDEAINMVHNYLLSL